jgi:hypothetical protein
MMAKMFYTLEETKAALGKNEEEIKQLSREGRLREFRDGARLMFKADQVEQLKNELGMGSSGSADHVDIGISDTGAPIGLVDSRSASATGISLVDTGRSGSGSGMVLKDDTALAADLGMTGSLGGVPSPGRPGSSSPLTGSRAGGSGINVFTDSEAGGADPSAQTAISSSVQDQVSLEGVGSGSGLLDLTRESDDTSLGAELLDEITPGGSKRGAPGESGGTAGGTAIGRSGVAGAVRGRVAGEPIYVESADPTAAAFGAMALAGVIALLLGGVAVFSGVMGAQPDVLKMLQETTWIMLAGGGILLAITFGIFGWIFGRTAR